ncbi:MAG: 2'-5' RNA ligase family protein [Chloroflexi bacterium]|nr:2'-5' RNA ligase family protein [Chloroflexota bacterium]MCL5275820.1 2'-5' RNA ligase family protein [Chloroflexota bacterium]
MPETGGSALAYLLPQEAARAVDAWRQRYDPHIDYIPPHVTVTYPPFVSEQDWENVRPRISECLKVVKAFKVRLASTGVFTDPQKVLWLRPEDGGNFAAIHNLLARSFPSQAPPSPLSYVPHVTLGFFDTLEALELARAAVMSEWQPQWITVDQLTLLQNISEGVWMVRDRIRLAAP